MAEAFGWELVDDIEEEDVVLGVVAMVKFIRPGEDQPALLVTNTENMAEMERLAMTRAAFRLADDEVQDMFLPSDEEDEDEEDDDEY